MEQIEDLKRSRNRDPGRIVGGIFFIFLGTIFWLTNSGIVTMDIWNYIWRFWPVFIILAGFQILLGRGAAAQLILGLISIVIFGGALIWGLIQVESPLIGQLGLNSLPFFNLINNLKLE